MSEKKNPPPFFILFEDAHLIAVIKPAGWLAQGDSSGAPAITGAIRDYLKAKQKGKQDDIFVGLVHRLDRNVEGVMVFAKTRKAASDLSDQIRRRSIKKFYRCLVEGIPDKEEDRLTHFIRKGKSMKATVFPRAAPDAKRAILEYRVIKKQKQFALLEVALQTGRFHQIRAQLSFIGHPIVGDLKYRAQTRLGDYKIALCASKLILTHPQNNKELIFEAPASEWEPH